MSDGWATLEAAITDARALVAPAAPDAATAAEGETYVIRLVAAALAGATLGHHFRTGGLTRAVPVHGGPNPDYSMWHAPVDPAGRYRLTGRLNGSERVGVGLYRIGRNGAPLIAGYAAFDRGNVAADGGFALDIAADASARGGLTLNPDSRILLIRILHRDDERAAVLALTGAPAAPGPALATPVRQYAD